jgi:hypothetical protein
MEVNNVNHLCRQSLKELDLRGNRLCQVRNVHCLSQLEHLNLGKLHLRMSSGPS